MNRSTRTLSVLLLALACAVLASVPALSTQDILGKDGYDSYKYMMMGLHGPDAKVASPFMYRILFPWLSFALGLAPLLFFRIVAITSVALMVLACSRIADALRMPVAYLWSALALALVTSVVKLCASAGYVTDLPLMAAAMWAAYFALSKRYVWLSLLATVMVANRELSFLLVLPGLYQLAMGLRRKDVTAPAAFAQALMLLAPPVLMLVFIRWLQGPPAQHFSLLDAIRSSPFPHPAYWTGITGRLGGWLFPLCALAFLLKVRALRAIVTMFMGSVAIALLQTLLGTDTSRLGATILPMAVVLAGAAMAHARLPRAGLAALFVVQYLSFVMDLTEPLLFEGFHQLIYIKYALAGASMLCLAGMLGALFWRNWRNVFAPASHAHQ